MNPHLHFVPLRQAKELAKVSAALQCSTGAAAPQEQTGRQVPHSRQVAVADTSSRKYHRVVVLDGALGWLPSRLWTITKEWGLALSAARALPANRGDARDRGMVEAATLAMQPWGGCQVVARDRLRSFPRRRLLAAHRPSYWKFPSFTWAGIH